MSNPNSLYKGYRFSSAVIKHAVWLYYRFNNSLRDTSEALLYRGIDISHETIRQWAYRFGKAYAYSLRSRAPRRGDKWHLDEVRVMMNGSAYWLWRAIDQNGYELDILLQPRRSAKAAKRFFKKLLKVLQYIPRAMITDKLRSYDAARKHLLKTVEHRRHKRLNNRIEVSHESIRVREKVMRRFKNPHQAQLFCSIFGVIRNTSKIGLYKLKSAAKKLALNNAFALWHQIAQEAKCV